MLLCRISGEKLLTEKEERGDVIARRRVVDIQYLLQQTVGL